MSLARSFKAGNGAPRIVSVAVSDGGSPPTPSSSVRHYLDLNHTGLFGTGALGSSAGTINRQCNC
jgi:hypothetical protein